MTVAPNYDVPEKTTRKKKATSVANLAKVKLRKVFLAILYITPLYNFLF